MQLTLGAKIKKDSLEWSEPTGDHQTVLGGVPVIGERYTQTKRKTGNSI